MSADLLQTALICVAILVIAFLYSSVGQAGASGYIATIALFNFSPDVIRPTALVLNILVALIGSWQFYREGHFSFRLFLPFAAASVPLAFIGGHMQLPSHVFMVIIGAVLVVAAVPFFLAKETGVEQVREPSVVVSLLVGAGIGLLSGLTGIGGGIFLTPLLLLFRWAPTRTAAAVSALFILVNSLAAFSGYWGSSQRFPAFILVFAVPAIVGGVIGSRLGSRYLPVGIIRRLLGVVLAITGLKLIIFR